MVSMKQLWPVPAPGTPARSRSRDWIRPAAFVAALVILVAATVWMHIQPPPPDPFRPAKTLSTQWWLYPIERNGFMRLPLVSRSPGKLFVLPGSTHAWIGRRYGDDFFSAQLLHTADRGSTWETITINPSTGSSRGAPAPVAFPVFDFSFVDARHGWVLDPTGHMLETRDGGKSWSSEGLPHDCFSLAVSGQRLVAGGIHLMSWSNDRGLRWQNVQLDSYVLARDIAPDGRIWAASGGGKVWSSANGSKWERVGAFSNGAFSYRNMRIQFADALHGFVQQGDEFSETVDGGQTLTPLVTFKAAGVLAFP